MDERTAAGDDFDRDASALLVESDGRVARDQHFVFFNNTLSPDGSVKHTGDNPKGSGDGDDKQSSRLVFPGTI